MHESDYFLHKILYLPARDMFAGIVFRRNDILLNHYYTWWAQTGKTIQLKRHNGRYNMDIFVVKKIKNNYEPVNQDFLLKKYPRYFEKLRESMLLEVLRND